MDELRKSVWLTAVPEVAIAVSEPAATREDSCSDIVVTGG